MIGDPPEAATGERDTQKATTPQKREVGKSSEQGRDGGPETGRKETPRSTFAGTEKVARETCKVCGRAKEQDHFAARLCGRRSLAPTCDQCRDATQAQPARARACAWCGVEKARDS